MPRSDDSGKRRNKRSRYDSPKKDSRNRGRSGRDSGRNYRRDKPEAQITQVICSDCGKETEIPFKPRSSKPVYCRACFEKQGRGRSNMRSKTRSSSVPSAELDTINEKLNKIMKALDIK